METSGKRSNSHTKISHHSNFQLPLQNCKINYYADAHIIVTTIMKIVFFGTPKYVLPILKSIDKKYKDKSGTSPIVAVVTRRPKPAGRKKILLYSAVDKWAYKKNVPRFFSTKDLLKYQVHADLGILAAYGEIVPQEILNLFPQGILNVHPSLLPKWRGASPVQASIIDKNKETGVTIIKLDSKLDHGPIISHFREKILENDTTESLRERLFLRSAEVLAELIDPYLKGKIKLQTQDEKQATYAGQITKNDGFIPTPIINQAGQGLPLSGHWDIHFMKNYSPKPDTNLVERFIRAMQPWPVAWTKIRIKNKESRIKILKAHTENQKLVLDEVQLEGKRPVSWQQFTQGYPKVIFE